MCIYIAPKLSSTITKNLCFCCFVLFLFFSVRCNYRAPVTKTITTNYGETFEIIVYFRQSLHDDYLEYHFQRSDGKFLIIYSIPVNYEGGLDQDPFKLIEHVAQNEYIKLYKIEDCIIYDVAQCAADFQQGELYIKGFLDIYNFVTPKEYDSTYQSVIRDVFKSNEFANYVDKSGSEPMANVGILIIKLSSKPKVDTVYFWNPSTNQYEANIDNGTGHSYTKISKEQRILYVLKVYIHMWLTNINTTSINTTTKYPTILPI